LSGEEPRLFLFTVAHSTESEAGEMHLGYIAWIFDGKISQKGEMKNANALSLNTYWGKTGKN
jgi:hypothetical protein